MPSLPVWASFLVAAAAGVLLNAAFPDRGWWPLTFFSLFLLLWAVHNKRFFTAFLLGGAASLVFWGSLISWLTLHLGPLPWAAVCILESSVYAVGIGGIAILLKYAPRVWPTFLGRIGVTPLVVAGVWGAVESVTARWPYDGFGWGRIAFSQAESPFAFLSAWVGVSGLSFLIMWVVALCFQLCRETGVSVLSRATVGVAVVTVLLIFPSWPITITGYTRVAAVQGNSSGGFFTGYLWGENLNNQVAATLPLRGHGMDMVVWPENSTDTDPTRSGVTAKILDEVSREMNAPIILGAITHPVEGANYNTSLAWMAGEGVIGSYDKIHLVPFAEYVPNREFFGKIFPQFVGLVHEEFSSGTRSNTYTVNNVVIGSALCFDIADDDLFERMIGGGAQIILAQTNNADFGDTDESLQQLALARMRAIEAGRSVVQVSTVGTSAIISPSGVTINQLPPFEAGAMLDTVPLSTTLTPASLWGGACELLLAGIGVAGLAIVGFTDLITRKRNTNAT